MIQKFSPLSAHGEVQKRLFFHFSKNIPTKALTRGFERRGAVRNAVLDERSEESSSAPQAERPIGDDGSQTYKY